MFSCLHSIQTFVCQHCTPFFSAQEVLLEALLPLCGPGKSQPGRFIGTTVASSLSPKEVNSLFLISKSPWQKLSASKENQPAKKEAGAQVRWKQPGRKRRWDMLRSQSPKRQSGRMKWDIGHWCPKEGVAARCLNAGEAW